MIVERVKEIKRKKRILANATPIDATKIPWRKLAPSALAVCSNKNKHRIVGVTSSEARKPSKEADAKIAMALGPARGRRYPTLRVGDNVRILRNKKQVGDKEWVSNFKPSDRALESVS